MAKGWFFHSREHSLASKGVKTAQRIKRAFIVKRVKKGEGVLKTPQKYDNKILVRYNGLDIEPITEVPDDIKILYAREVARQKKTKLSKGLGCGGTVSFKYVTPEQALTIIGLVKGKKAYTLPNTYGRTYWWKLK